MKPARRIETLAGYPFGIIDEKVGELKKIGADPIDFGVGDPTIPTPKLIRDALCEGVEKYADSGYPSYSGAPFFREAVAEWNYRRFGVRLDPNTEVCATIGSKEAIFNFHEGLVNPGDIVLAPTPGYPPYGRGTMFAEGTPWYYPISPENGFLPDLNAIPSDVLKRAKLIWVNYPNSPTGALAPDKFFVGLIEFAARHDIVIASDEAYTEIYFGARPKSILEYSRDNIIVFQSLSKRSAMTGWRIGWTAGDSRLISLFRKVKTNIDSGTPTFIQHAAVVALSDETHVEEMRSEYAIKRDIICSAFADCGLPKCLPDAAIYVWQRVPNGMDCEQFAQKLLSPEIAIVGTPGAWLGEKPLACEHPGRNYVRFALVPSVKRCKEAADRIRRALAR